MMHDALRTVVRGQKREMEVRPFYEAEDLAAARDGQRGRLGVA